MFDKIQGWLDMAYSYIAILTQNIIFTPEGKQLVNERSLFISKKLKEAQQQGEQTYKTNIVRNFGLFKSPYQLCAIDTGSLKESAIIDMISGTDDPNARQPFSNFGKMMGVTSNSPLHFFLKQDQKAYDDRQLLANMLKPHLLASLSKRVNTKLETWYQENRIQPIRCLFQSMHQFVMECIAEEILGLQQIPKNTHEIIEHAEEAITYETEGYTLFGWDIHLTPSQQKFKKAKDNFLTLALQIVHDNENAIKNGNGYLSKILNVISDTNSKDDAFAKLENQKLLGSIGAGLMLATGTLSVTLTFALLYLNLDTLENIKTKQTLNHAKNFIDNYFKEVLRYAASGQTFRFSSAEKTFEMSNNEKINISANTLVCLNVRSAASNNEHWPEAERFNPNRFEANDAPKMHTAKFAPFLLGPRMCPGRHVAEVIFKELVNFFVQKNLYIEAKDEIKDVNNEYYWTTNDFTVRPQPGRLIQATIANAAHSNKLRLNA